MEIKHHTCLSMAPLRQLPVTCLGTGNGKLGSASSVQFAMGLFGKTQEKAPKELVNEVTEDKEMRVVDGQI